VYHNVHPLQHLSRTRHKAGNGSSACVPLQHSSLLSCHQFLLLPATPRIPSTTWLPTTTRLCNSPNSPNSLNSELNWTQVRGISPLGGRKRRHLLRENIHQPLLRQFPLLPRKRATACTSPGVRVRSVLGPACYEVTYTPWRTCYTIFIFTIRDHPLIFRHCRTGMAELLSDVKFRKEVLLATCFHAGFLMNLFFRPWRWRR
jgi:hypothetical protein